MTDHTPDLLALSLIPGIGDRNIKQLISYCGSASEVFKSQKKKINSIPGIGKKLTEILCSHKTQKEADFILKQAEKKGITVFSYLDSKYPQRLKSVTDSPVILYVKGNGNLNPDKTLAVVGTRKATNYGKYITRKIVEDCQALDVQIISGLAYGIDIESHRTALKTKQSTISVLAGGLDLIYPAVHKKYAEEMQENGAIVSECPPGTKPDPHLFPARNRIIAGMADATIVVEAASRGGALITAKITDSYNRPLFAVPGNLDNNYSTGTNHLISTQMALIYTGIEDLKHQLSWEVTSEVKKVEKPELYGDELVLYKLFEESDQTLQIDEISIKSQISINKVAALLLSLEFKGIVKSKPGKKFGLS